jgi:hypothetical protein
MGTPVPAVLMAYYRATRTSHQTVTDVQMCDHAGTKHSPEQPCRHRQRSQTENAPHGLGTQRMHGTRPELAVTSRARRERNDGASFGVWAPWGCITLGSPRPRSAAQTAPYAVSAVSAGGDARLWRVRRARSPSRRYIEDDRRRMVGQLRVVLVQHP